MRYLPKSLSYLVFTAVYLMLASAIFLIFAILLTSVGVDITSDLYSMFPLKSGLSFSDFLQISSVSVAALALVIAVLTYLLTTRASKISQRKHHTVTLLMNARFSSEFVAMLKSRQHSFPEYTDITFENWNAARLARASNPFDQAEVHEAERCRNSADAVVGILNFYEFLAVCLEEEELDKEMLYKTYRSIMCNLVDDSRHLIAGMQQINPNTYEHLTALYGQWRKHNARDINGSPNDRPIPRPR
jgi:hypothetical protein